MVTKTLRSFCERAPKYAHLCTCLRAQISVNVRAPTYVFLLWNRTFLGRAERELFAAGGASVRNYGRNAI